MILSNWLRLKGIWTNLDLPRLAKTEKGKNGKVLPQVSVGVRRLPQVSDDVEISDSQRNLRKV